MLQQQTFRTACPTTWPENSWHRYGMNKLRHCHTSLCITELEMWANAQREGRLAEYIGGALCSTPRSLADAHY